ncbi:hypothetical protein TNCV_3908411 [Trichonephila clavipes]|nr:hypothetical protein TNCV_3908411 [Trichonephila clavipes]
MAAGIVEARVRVLVPLKTCHEEDHVKYVMTQRPPVDAMWKFESDILATWLCFHITIDNSLRFATSLKIKSK